MSVEKMAVRAAELRKEAAGLNRQAREYVKMAEDALDEAEALDHKRRKAMGA